MQTKRLLTFLWCGSEYGIAAENVLGMSHCGINYHQELPHEKASMKEESSKLDGKRVLLVTADDVQIGIIVDEVVGIADFDAGMLEDKCFVDFQIWNLKPGTR